ncbi:MAG: 30S ribosomal protein S6 [Clostridia bacterium]|nr:30S ribosomal protein S6 [Clostridia bacterium]
MNKYEALYIITPELDEEAISASIEKFSQLVATNGGVVEKVDEWGRRRLAYEIDYKSEGYYVLMHFEGASELPREMERNFKNDENIIRYVVVRRQA